MVNVLLNQIPGGSSMIEEVEKMFCFYSAVCIVIIEWSVPCMPGINTALDNFFICMTAGN